MEYLATFGLAAAFRLGPWCWTAYPAAVLHWDTLWSSLMLECSQSKVLAVKASQRLSVGKSAVARGWPLFALVSASAGLVVEIITDRPRDRYRTLCQALALLIMLVLQISYGGGLRRPSITASNLFCLVVVARLWFAAGTYRCRTGELAMTWAAIVALGPAVTAGNAWLSAFLLIAAFAALIMSELYSSSAALGPTIFVLMLFGGVSTSMASMQSKSVITKVFSSSLALFDFQCIQSLVGFDNDPVIGFNNHVDEFAMIGR